jgi:hypothetical protein
MNKMMGSQMPLFRLEVALAKPAAPALSEPMALALAEPVARALDCVWSGSLAGCIIGLSTHDSFQLSALAA